jgi:hypothetical protein
VAVIAGLHVGICLESWGVLPLASQYILSLMPFGVNNKNIFILNSEKHNVSTRRITNFYQRTSNFTVYQKGVYYMGI